MSKRYEVSIGYVQGSGFGAVHVRVEEHCPFMNRFEEPHRWGKGRCMNCGRSTTAAHANIERAMAGFKYWPEASAERRNIKGPEVKDASETAFGNWICRGPEAMSTMNDILREAFEAGYDAGRDAPRRRRRKKHDE